MKLIYNKYPVRQNWFTSSWFCAGFGVMFGVGLNPSLLSISLWFLLLTLFASLLLTTFIINKYFIIKK